MSMSNHWYREGIKFKCQACGRCCLGFPGYVWLTSEDIKKISKHVKMTEKNFLEKYARNIYGLISLKEMKAPTYECIFFENNKCKIYPVRPVQCRNYPFWPQLLTSKETWEKNVKSVCPGTHATDSISYSKEAIHILLEEYKKELPF
jgi:uncharacterized protein